MAGQQHNGMQCSEFDALLSQAIDGTLSGERLTAFEAHGRECRMCGPLLQEAEAGRGWLKSLEEVEPPLELVNNILLATTGVVVCGCITAASHLRRSGCCAGSRTRAPYRAESTRSSVRGNLLRDR